MLNDILNFIYSNSWIVHFSFGFLIGFSLTSICIKVFNDYEEIK